MAVKVSAAVWDAGPRERTMRYVLLALADHADQSGFAFPSIARLAERCALTDRSIIGALKQLQHENWITKTRKGKASQYQINLEKLGIEVVLDEKDSGDTGEQTSHEDASHEIHCSPQVKSTASIGEIHCKPPAPPYRSNRQEPSVEQSGKHSELRQAVGRVFEYYREVCKRSPAYKLTSKRLQMGIDRLKELRSHYGDQGEQKLKDAVLALATSDWHMGRDPKTNGRSYCDWIDHLTTSEEKVTDWLSKFEEQDRKPKPVRKSMPSIGDDCAAR